MGILIGKLAKIGCKYEEKIRNCEKLENNTDCMLNRGRDEVGGHGTRGGAHLTLRGGRPPSRAHASLSQTNMGRTSPMLGEEETDFAVCLFSHFLFFLFL